MKRIILLSSIVVIALAVGFFQERTKIALNFTIECSGSNENWDFQTTAERDQSLLDCQLNRPSDYYHNHRPIGFYSTLSKTELGRVKWILAITWIVVFFGLNSLLMRVYFRNWKGEKILVAGYMAMLGICSVFFLLQKCSGMQQQAYGVAREILGALQSLIPALVIILALSFTKYTYKEQDHENFN